MPALKLLDAAERGIIKASGQQHALAAGPDGYMGQDICWAACQDCRHILLQYAIGGQGVTWL